MFDRLTPVNRILIIANVAVFLLQSVPVAANWLIINLALWPSVETTQFGTSLKPWQLVTYRFLHGNWDASVLQHVRHLHVRRRHRAIIWARALCGLLLLVRHRCGSDAFGRRLCCKPACAASVGASGGVFGSLLAFGMAFPKRMIMLLIPPIPLPAWLFVTLYGALELYLGITQNTGIAHFAHLGGMATGFVVIRYWQGQRRAPRR